jgi:hypothetical protein
LNSSTDRRLHMPTRQNKSGIGTRASKPSVPDGATLHEGRVRGGRAPDG